MSSDYWIDQPTGRRVEEEKAVIYTLPKASRKTLERARKTWTEARLEDFDREHKDFVHKETGVHYRRVGGDPLLGGAQLADVALFFVADGYVVYLRPVGDPGHVISKQIGDMGSRQATPMDFVQAYTEAGAR